MSANAWSVPSARFGAASAAGGAARIRSATGSSERTAPRWSTSRRESGLRSRHAGRRAAAPAGVSTFAAQIGSAAPRSTSRTPPVTGPNSGLLQVAHVDAADRPRLVEEVAAVPVPQLGRHGPARSSRSSGRAGSRSTSARPPPRAPAPSPGTRRCPKSVMFCWVLSNSTQNGSAPGSGKSTPVPTFWFWQRNGLVPSQGTTGACADAGLARSERDDEHDPDPQASHSPAGISPFGRLAKPRASPVVRHNGASSTQASVQRVYKNGL